MVKITVDGKEIQAEASDTIRSAAKKAGVKIPALCYLKDQTPQGACRICLVEVEGARGLMASCTTPVTEGMVVNTRSENVIEARKFVVELLLSEGDHDCITCEANGECKLQKLAYDYGVNNTDMKYKGEKSEKVFDDSSRFIIRDSSKCILCNKCVLACNERGGHGILFKNERGFKSRIASDDCSLGESGCVMCGECIQACPVGALYEKKRVGKGRPWDLKKVNTTCPYCGVGCQLTVHVDEENNKPVKVTGRYTRPNEGMLFIKGRIAYDFQLSDSRLTSPLIKKDGKHVEVSWDEALDYAADRLKKIIDEHGPDSYAGVTCGRSTNENNYAGMKFARAAVGTNNVDHCART